MSLYINEPTLCVALSHRPLPETGYIPPRSPSVQLLPYHLHGPKPAPPKAQHHCDCRERHSQAPAQPALICQATPACPAAAASAAAAPPSAALASASPASTPAATPSAALATSPAAQAAASRPPGLVDKSVS